MFNRYEISGSACYRINKLIQERTSAAAHDWQEDDEERQYVQDKMRKAPLSEIVAALGGRSDDSSRILFHGYNQYGPVISLYTEGPANETLVRLLEQETARHNESWARVQVFEMEFLPYDIAFFTEYREETEKRLPYGMDAVDYFINGAKGNDNIIVQAIKGAYGPSLKDYPELSELILLHENCYRSYMELIDETVRGLKLTDGERLDSRY